MNSQWFTIFDVKKYCKDIHHPNNFMTTLKKQGVIHKVKLEERPRRDVGCGTSARVYVSYIDLEDAIDTFLELTKEHGNYTHHHMKRLDALFVLKGRLNEPVVQ